MYKIPKEINYNGVILPGTIVTPEMNARIKELKVTEKDVVVVGYPRSGNNWMCYAVYLIQNSDTDITDPKHYLRNRFSLHFSEHGTFESSDLSRAMKSKSKQRVINAHTFFSDVQKQILQDMCKTVYVVRNPKDMLASYYHFYRNNGAFGPFTGSWEEFFQLYKAKRVGFGDWADHVSSYLSYKHLPNMFIIKYEDAKQDLRRVLRQLATFLGKAISDEKLDEIQGLLDVKSMKSQDTLQFGSIVRKGLLKPGTIIRAGEMGEWRQWFTKEQSDVVDSRCREVLSELNYNLESKL